MCYLCVKAELPVVKLEVGNAYVSSDGSVCVGAIDDDYYCAELTTEQVKAILSLINNA